MVSAIEEKGIEDQRVLAAMSVVPRHFFLDEAFDEWAYQDKAFSIGYDQTISQPYTVAYQTELLQVKKKDKILEIGTGSGYQAAILAAMGANVLTIERQEGLYHRSRKLLREMGFKNIRVFFGDGSKGLPQYAPFDGIIVTAGATEIPDTLKSQLKIGGRLVIPVGDGQTQTMRRITRTGEDTYQDEQFATFRFVPFLRGIVKD